MKFSQKAILSVLFVLLASASSAVQAQPRQTREEYIARYKNIAIAHMERYGIPASITMAQGILESDCGNSRLSRTSNNHFGIKCKKSWKGERVYHDDDAKGECFRSYPSVEESYLDHAEFLDSSPRYDSLFAYPATDYRSWARGLKAAGYATAPDYAQRLIKIIEDNRLYLLDQDNGSRRYASFIASASGNDEVARTFEGQSTAASDELVNPDAYRVNIKIFNGYNIYRTNRVYYVVAKDGDTYRSLGALFHIAERTMRKFNDAPKDATLQKGDIVYIERKKSRWEGNAQMHTVRHDETLYDLSQSYGIRLRSLAKLNRIRNGGDVRNGQIIRLR